MELLHQEATLRDATEADHWRQMLAERRQFLTNIDEKLRTCRRGWIRPQQVQLARECVRAALAEHRDDWPDEFARYVLEWHADTEKWRKRLDRLPRKGRMPEALQHLNIQHLATYDDMRICGSGMGDRIPMRVPVGGSIRS